MSNKRIIKYDKNAKLPGDFNWETYVALHKDLTGFSEYKAKSHYLLFGINEHRQYKHANESSSNELSSNELSNSNLSTYKIINENSEDSYIYNSLWCHVHCNTPNLLNDNESFMKVAKYFSVVFTCDDINEGDELSSEYTVLKVNKTLSDIIQKKSVEDYLNEKNYDYDLLITMTY
jgi:hypothetical protein